MSQQIIQKTALVNFLPEQMFNLVNAIEQYPEFLSSCYATQVINQTQDELMAKIMVRFAGVQYSFTTRNQLFFPNEMRLNFVDGPFKELFGCWRFDAIQNQGCKITLELKFVFSNKLLNYPFKMGFNKLANHLIDDFCKRAQIIYGK